MSPKVINFKKFHSLHTKPCIKSGTCIVVNLQLCIDKKHTSSYEYTCILLMKNFADCAKFTWDAIVQHFRSNSYITVSCWAR